MARRRISRVSVILLFTLLFLVYIWKRPESNLLSRIPLSQHYKGPTAKLPFEAILYDDTRTRQPFKNGVVKQEINTDFIPVQNPDPSFHVLIPASASNDKLCKTLLSSFLLNYPPPTLINFGEVFTGDNWDKGSHAGKIKGVYNFLSQTKQIRDYDLVLVIDGYDVWFQLPPEVLIVRYHKLIRETNLRLRKRYGTTTKQMPLEGIETQNTQMYEQTVVFGADKLCWPNAQDDPACASLPESTLAKDSYGISTDKDPEGYTNRPKYLNSGAIIGPVSDVRAIYKRALEKVDQGLGAIGDQFVFAEIMGEQEYVRQLLNPITHDSWFLGLFREFSPFHSSSPAMRAVKKMTLIPKQHYEYSIGLDYTSSLFQTMTHSAEDIEFITYNNVTSRSPLGLKALPLDIFRARPPYPSNDTLTATMTNRVVPLSHTLDELPASDQNTWLNYPLATNLRSLTVPSLLHINGDKSLLDSWWPSIWFQANSRALLRHYIRTPQPFLWGTIGGKEKTWDMRGGRGGVWTPDGRWSEWGDICQGVEESVFADGKGKWGEEEGDGRTWNSFGKQVTGKVVGDN